MDILKTFFLPLFSVFMLFILTRLMGYREVSQLSMFDYITGISIGSVAAEMATGIENLQKPLIAMIIYAFAGISISVLTNKSVRLRKNLMGQPIVLINNGIIFYDKMKKAKLDISELLMELRARGYFNITQIKTVVLEINGKFSVVSYSTDENLNSELCVNLIMDGELIEENMLKLGLDRSFMDKKIAENGIGDISCVFLAVYVKNEIRFFKKEFSSEKENYIF